MKKLICVLLSVFVLIGCSSKVETPNKNNDDKIENQTENREDKTNIDDSPEYNTYRLYTVIDTDEGSWYYDVPYLNEIKFSVYLCRGADPEKPKLLLMEINGGWHMQWIQKKKLTI